MGCVGMGQKACGIAAWGMKGFIMGIGAPVPSDDIIMGTIIMNCYIRENRGDRQS